MKPTKTKKTGGYSYTVTLAQIREYRALPVEARLQWLAEANHFLWLAMSDKAKKAREAFRKGEI